MLKFGRKVGSKFVDDLASAISKALLVLVIPTVLSLAIAFISGHRDVGMALLVVAVILLTIILGIRVRRFSTHRYGAKRQKKEFRGLSFEVDNTLEYPKVINRDVTEAMCRCGSSIVGSDKEYYDHSVNYLRCAKGDFVGNEMPYLMFKRIKDEEKEKERIKQEQEEKARKEAVEKQRKEREQAVADGKKLPAPDYDAGKGYPRGAGTGSHGGRDSFPSDAELMQKFYNNVIWELEQELQRRAYKRKKVDVIR